MLAKVITHFAVETPDGDITFHPGQLIRLRKEQFTRLQGKVEPVNNDNPPKVLTCYCCRGSDFWLSIYDKWTCRRCHPPAPGAEKKEAA